MCCHLGYIVTHTLPLSNIFLDYFFQRMTIATMKEKEARLSVRVPPALLDRLAAAAKATGVDQPSIVRQCLAAFCDHVEMHGRAVFPIHIGGLPLPPQTPGPADQNIRFNETSTPKRK